MIKGVSSSLFSNKVSSIIKRVKPMTLSRQVELPAKIALATVGALSLSQGRSSTKNETVQKNSNSTTACTDTCHSDYWCGLAFP